MPKKTEQKTNIKKRRMERREMIKALIEKVGLWNVTQKELASRFGVQRQTIAKDIKEILKGIPMATLDEITLNLDLSFKNATSACMHVIATTDDPKLKVEAAKALAGIYEKYTKMFEDYGIKEKVADKLEMVGGERLLTHEDFKRAYDKFYDETGARKDKRADGESKKPRG